MGRSGISRASLKSAATHSAWDGGIAALESVLEPGSATLEAMTQSQKDGLESLKASLLTGNDKAEVPSDLLAARTDTSMHLLEVYAGVTQVRLKSTMKKVLNAKRFITRINSDISERLAVQKLRASYQPKEWEKLGLESRKRLRELLSWDSLCRWDFNIMEVSKECGGNPLLFVGWALLASPYSHQAMEVSCGIQCELKNKGYFFLDDLGVEEEKLCEFLRVVEAKYNKNPYHNNIHAADVTQTVHCLIQMNRKLLATQKLEIFATIVAAVSHDICHPGLNNCYQISARTNLALQYNDIAVLENMHAFEAFRHILGDQPQPKLDILSGLKKEEVNDFRKLVINLILQTDMTRHFSEINVIKGLLVSSPLDDLLKDNDTRAKLLGFVLHMADISNPAKPTPLATEWADRCLAEFFAQGDKEKARGLPVSPLCDRSSTSRPESQIGFIKFIVQPSFKVLSTIVPAVEDKGMPIIAQNVEYWEKQKAEGD